MQLPIDKELVAPSDTRHLVKIREVVKSTAACCFADTGVVTRITLAVDEAVANVMEHAYEGMDPGDIRITIHADEERFEVIVTDEGHAFDPNAIKAPDMPTHVKEGRRGGLGIFLMRQIMDEVKYTFVENLRNELRMVKFVQAKNEGEESCQS